MAHQQETVVPNAIDTKPSRLNKIILIKIFIITVKTDM